MRLLVEREDEISAFVPEQWFSIHGLLEKDRTKFEIKYYGEEPNKKTDLVDEKLVNKIVTDVKGKTFEIVDIRKRERKQNPTPPFITSKLQQEASSKLGFSAKKTMMLAQRLYEGIQITDHGPSGLITYMRTDSVRTDPEVLGKLREYIEDSHGKDYLSSEPIIYKKKGKGKVQDAHEAIRPTSLEFTPESVRGDLEPDEFKLYEMIWNKFISSQMSPSIVDLTTIILKANGHFFKASGSVIKFMGHRKVYLESLAEKVSKKGHQEDEDDDKINAGAVGLLPEMSNGEEFVPVKDPESVEHWTSPPPRFNEAMLVKTLEEQGIGRPSTYASIISNIQDRGYVDKTEKRFLPTELGIVVCRMLIESFPDVMDVAFTANIEEFLDQIEDGDLKWKKVLRNFWKGFEGTLKKAKEEMKNLKRTLIPTGMKCSKCGDGEYMIKWGRNGQFLACSNYPECTSTEDFKKRLDGTIEILPKDYSEHKCAECGKRMVVKKGRYGRFLACEDYPSCKGTAPYMLNIQCPECKVGYYVEKRSRFGKTFYGCSSYPDCNNVVWTLPRKFDCPACGYPVMAQNETKRAGKFLQCPKCKHRVDLNETPYAEKDDSNDE